MNVKSHFYNVKQRNVTFAPYCLLVGSQKGTGAGVGELLGVAYSRPGSPAQARHGTSSRWFKPTPRTNSC